MLQRPVESALDAAVAVMDEPVLPCRLSFVQGLLQRIQNKVCMRRRHNTIDFLLRAHRDKVAARRYFEKAIAQNGEPETVTIDKSGSNLAALQAINAEREAAIRIRQKKYLNNVVEQDHRAIKRRTRPMLGFKNFRCARIILGGIEFMHMIVKGQMKGGGIAPTPAHQFYSLVA
jgi:transposase-like protein